MVKTYDQFKYGTYIWTFSDVDITNGYFMLNNNEGAAYLYIRYNGSDKNLIAAGGTLNIGGIDVCFGTDNGWNYRGNGTWNFTGNFPTDNTQLETIKLVMEPTTRAKGSEHADGFTGNILLRQVYVNDVLVSERKDIGDIWQEGSTHPGFQYEFGIACDDASQTNGTMTISFEYIPYTAE